MADAMASIALSKLIDDLPTTPRPRYVCTKTPDITKAIKANEPFTGYLSTGKRKDGIYYIFHRKTLLYRLNCATGAYSFDTNHYETGLVKLIDLIRKAKGIYETPLEEAISNDTRQA